MSHSNISINPDGSFSFSNISPEDKMKDLIYDVIPTPTLIWYVVYYLPEAPSDEQFVLRIWIDGKAQDPPEVVTDNIKCLWALIPVGLIKVEIPGLMDKTIIEVWA